jgi:hypothetical protein
MAQGQELGQGIPRVDTDIQNQLDIVMAIIDENQDKITDGEYLRAMNALGSLHKHKRTAFGARRGGGGGGGVEGWLTLDNIVDDDELYDEVMELADDIVVEICGEGSSIYDADDHNMVSRGEEDDVFDLVLNYNPQEGNAGYHASPIMLHCALRMITLRMFKDTYNELETVRPVSCQCGWRGAQGNWDRHVRNARHQRWVAAREENRRAAVRAASASLAAAAAADALALENDEDYQVSRMYRAFMDTTDTDTTTVVAAGAGADSDVVYIDEEHWTPDSQRRREELIAAAVAAGKRIVYIHHTTTTQWRRIQ